MAHYIDKDALVAEIEKLIDEIYAGRPFDALSRGQQTALWYIKSIMSSIKSLEVKEIDLEKYYHDFLQKEWFGKNCNRTMSEMMAFTAKHFFELGLKAQKDNIRHSMDETPKYPCDILFITNVDNVFLYRYMENGRPVDKDTPYFNNILDGKCWYYCSDIIND